jgi:hypothetical protein
MFGIRLSLKKAVLSALVSMRIRNRPFRSMPMRIQKLYNNFTVEIIYIFISKMTNYLILGLSEGPLSYGKSTHFLPFFFFVGHFCPPRILVWIEPTKISADPDLHHCYRFGLNSGNLVQQHWLKQLPVPVHSSIYFLMFRYCVSANRTLCFLLISFQLTGTEFWPTYNFQDFNRRFSVT